MATVRQRDKEPIPPSMFPDALVLEQSKGKRIPYRQPVYRYRGWYGTLHNNHWRYLEISSLYSSPPSFILKRMILSAAVIAGLEETMERYKEELSCPRNPSPTQS